MLFRHYKDTICLLNAIWTQRGHYERRKKSRRRVGVNAPPRTRAKIGEGHPLRASERHADTATDGNKPEIEPTSDIFTRADQRAESDKKTRHRRNHAATVPPRADERQERRRKDTARPPHQPKNLPERPPTSGRRKTASGHRQTAGDGKRTTPERRESDTPTPRARAHTSRTAADMYARKGATRVVIAAYSIYIYIFIPLPPCVYLYYAFIHYTCIFIHSYVYLYGYMLL